MSKNIALVVGASSGFGKEVAIELLRKDFIVYAAARRLEAMKEIENSGGRLLKMDVTEDKTVRTGVNQILQEEGRIDVVINNAGYGAYGTIENVPMDEVIRQFDVNLFGMARVNNAVLPSLRKQGKGRIIMTASLVSNITTPGSGWYAATKHAIKAMANSLRMEVAHLGISVIQIEPGPVRTGFEEVAINSLDEIAHDDSYEEVIRGFKNYVVKSYASAPDVSGTVKAMIHAATSKRPRSVYRTTSDAKILPKVASLLGTSIFSSMLLATLKKHSK